MRVGSRQSILALTNGADHSNPKVQIFADLPRTLRGWDAGTRISPIWGLREFHTDQPRQYDFEGEHEILLIGPIVPARIWTELEAVATAKHVNIWLSLGMYNVIVHVAADSIGKRIKNVIRAWARRNRIPFEHWHLIDGAISNWRAHLPFSQRSPSPLKKLAQAASKKQDNSIRVPTQEFYVTMASGLTRSAAIHPSLYTDMVSISSSIEKLLLATLKGDLPIVDLHARMINVNAALSRFVSQAFSGISPILGTECHFWTHSLLGTGTANIALRNLVEFIQTRLGCEYLDERVAQLSIRVLNVPDRKALLTDNRLLTDDLLGRIDVPTESKAELRPLITYFSGRDGFSSLIQTLSAPLTCISEANSRRSNILTVTIPYIRAGNLGCNLSRLG
jgi:hypothetical protein